MPDKINLFKRLENILRAERDISEDQTITKDTLFSENLGMDSLDRYEFGLTVEEKLGMRIPEEKHIELNNLGDYVDYIKSNYLDVYE